jgi:UDP-3-O-[3-hydroxymyristoyl] N-acetylglucosamine deacetylase/3-hydroxyacyl-[acyl-carrier-protein] dehydratase
MLPKPVLAARQSTIEREVALAGVGLHTGKPVTLTFVPAEPRTGVRFVRADLPGAPVLPVAPANLTGGVRGTNLTLRDVTVHTIEHVMAACLTAGIDNVIVRLDGPEPPAADGSAQAFVEKLREAGVVSQDAQRRASRVTRPFTVGDDRGHLACFPHPTFKVSYTLSYPGTVIGTQFHELEVTPETLAAGIAPARTFCLLQEVEALKAANLALGGSLENALVVDGQKLMNEGPLRFEDEFVRHKILDLVGDLATLGGAIQGHFVAIRTGHRHNIELVKTALDKQALVQIEEPKMQLDIEEIRKILPHRYPFLLIDRILECEPGVRAVGLKNVTSNEQFFNGHFPERSVMPGVLILEAMAQVAGVCILSLPEHRGKTPYFTGMDGVHFRKPIVPGDQVRIEIEVAKVRGAMGKIACKALVDSRVAAEGILKFTVM